MKISLIIPTINRVLELQNLLLSIESQIYRDYEVIIVDQNEDQKIIPILSYFSTKLKIDYLHLETKGAAKARNYGAAYATGEILFFPDDDSELPDDLLCKAIKGLTNANEISVLFGRSIDKRTGKNSMLNFSKFEVNVNKHNVYKTTIESTMFIRAHIFKQYLYDETFGVGTFYGAEEGADLVYRLLYDKITMIYKPDLFIYHPEKVVNFTNQDALRSYNYGKGFGRLIAKHFIKYKNVSLFLKGLYFNIRTIFGVLLYFNNEKKKKYYLNTLKGRYTGFLLSIRDYTF